LRARGHGFRFGKASAAGAGSFLFAYFAALRLVLKVLVMEEVLFSRCEDEIGSTVYAFEDAVLKLRHSNFPVIDLEWLSDVWDGAAITAPPSRLLDLPAIFLPVSFTGKRLLGPELLAWLQVERVSLNLFDDVLLLHFALEATKGIFQRFALLKLYFSQPDTPPDQTWIFQRDKKPVGV
jgi:hypothetical protein